MIQPEIDHGCSFPPSCPIPSLLFLPCPFHMLLMGHRAHTLLATADHTLMLQQKLFLSYPLTSTFNHSKWHRELREEARTHAERLEWSPSNSI